MSKRQRAGACIDERIRDTSSAIECLAPAPPLIVEVDCHFTYVRQFDREGKRILNVIDVTLVRRIPSPVASVRTAQLAAR